ncbi:MAG: hypothetical protein Q4D16_22795 [Eubacteriales bacterium]|nr:hypothetical protein [Eubacteriales bacterium]
MNDQAIILIFLIAATVITLYLYIWKAKKEIEYKKDERWLMVQNKAINTANYVNYLLIILIAVGDTVTLFHDTEITFTFNRVLIFATLFIGLRNAMELFSLKYFDKQL